MQPSFTVKKTIYSHGSMHGVPCMKIDVPNDYLLTSVDVNTIVTLVLDSKLKNVVVRGSLKENPELRTLILGLANKNKFVVLSTVGDDEIGTIRQHRFVKLILNFIPPTPSFANISLNNLTLLKENDDLCPLVGSEDDYKSVKDFLTGKVITRPTVVFFVLKSKVDEDTFEKIKQSYLEDCEKFNFKTSIIYQ